MEGPSTRLNVESLRQRLRARVATLATDAVIGDATRLFVEAAAEPCTPSIWSLEFQFDEDDSRVACLEARFGNGLVDPDLRGYSMRILLPKLLPKTTFDRALSSPHLRTIAKDGESLVARFVRALDELGAYRLIEGLPFREIAVERR